MNKAKTLLATFLLTILLVGFTEQVIAQSNPGYSKEIEDRIKRVEENLEELIKTDDRKITLQDRMKTYNIPGVTIAVVKDYKMEWARGYGWADVEQKIPVTTQTLFQAASISKSLNAVGVLKLAQDKKIDLHADINNYLTSWKFPYDSSSGEKKITVTNLLSHTAGTSIHGFRGYANGEGIPTVVQVLDGQPPANSKPVRSMFAAGTRVQYSGGGITIAQLIVMDVSKRSYDQYAWNSVLKPLGMTNSFYSPPPGDKLKFLATGYRRDGQPVAGKYHIYPEQAAASLWTNPSDLAKYIVEMQLAYQGKSGKLLSKEMVTTMLTPVMGDAALGVFIMTKGNDRFFGHGGANEGFRCQYLGSVEGGNGVVVMVNSDNGAILQEIINSVATVYDWKDFYIPVIKKVVTVSEELLNNYRGEYELGSGFNITIIKDGQNLKAQATGQPVVDLYAEADNKFFLKVVDAQIEFVKDETNKVTKLILYQNGRTTDGKKIK